MATEPAGYAARLEVDHPEELNRLTSFFRLIWIIPIGIIAGLVSGGGELIIVMKEAGEVTQKVGGIGSSLAVATAFMILFQRRYPRWWFDFRLEVARFGGRVFAYLALLTDQYPSTVEEQSVHLEIDYPDVERDLNRWLPLVKWILAIPHYIVLLILGTLSFFAVIFAWFAILFTGRYPRGLFDFVVGVWRWGLRVGAYTSLLVTDQYPPFSLS
jgi:hypothetical protein